MRPRVGFGFLAFSSPDLCLCTSVSVYHRRSFGLSLNSNTNLLFGLFQQTVIQRSITSSWKHSNQSEVNTKYFYNLDNRYCGFLYFKQTPPPSPSHAGSCREGWVSFKSGCYLLSDNLITWSQAEKQCQTHEAHLLVPNDEEELVRPHHSRRGHTVQSLRLKGPIFDPFSELYFHLRLRWNSHAQFIILYSIKQLI